LQIQNHNTGFVKTCKNNYYNNTNTIKKRFSNLVQLVHEHNDDRQLLQHFERENRFGDETVGDVLRAVGDLLLRGDGGYGEGLAEQGVNVQLGQLLYFDDAAWLEDLVEMVGQLVVYGLDELEEVCDLLNI
jgi:hypothetical protein